MRTVVSKGQKRVSVPLELELPEGVNTDSCGCWELNYGPLQEQYGS